jgi:hypothetical protein
METLVPADPVKLARSWLSEAGQYPWTVTVTKNRPNPLTGRVVTVRRNGGLRPDLVTDAAWLSVECYAANDDDTAQLAHRTWGLLFAMQDEVIDGVQCYRVQALGAPNDFPDSEGQRPRFVMSVQATFRTIPV